MTRYRFALLALLVMSCGLWQPYGAIYQAPSTATPSPTVSAFQVEMPISSTPTPQTCTVTADILNLRSGPGTAYQAVGWLMRGDLLTIEAQRGTWLKVGNGWVHSNYCER